MKPLLRAFQMFQTILAFKLFTPRRRTGPQFLKILLVTFITMVACTLLWMYFKDIILGQEIGSTAFEEERYSKVSLALRQNLTVQNDTNRFPLVYEMSVKYDEKEYDNESARLVGFPLKHFKDYKKYPNSTRKVIFLATSYFGQWNPNHYYFLHVGQESFKRYACPVDNCVVTTDPKEISKANAVLFHIRDIIIYKIPNFRRPDQIWILYSMEPPWLELIDFKQFNGLFNWTMSYRSNSDLRITYGFIGRYFGTNVTSYTNSRGILTTEMLKMKENKAVWYVSNCCAESQREKYVEELRQHFPVDVFGGCGIEGCKPAGTSKCYKRIEKKYKFYLAFENAICKSYVTEKFFNILEYNIIPVVFGGVDYGSITPHRSIINAMDFAGPKELGEFLWSVANNDDLYMSYFEWKMRYRSYLYPWMCELCRKLHEEPIATSIKMDLQTWWTGSDKCRRWTPNGIEEVEDFKFPCYDTHIFQ